MVYSRPNLIWNFVIWLPSQTWHPHPSTTGCEHCGFRHGLFVHLTEPLWRTNMHVKKSVKRETDKVLIPDKCIQHRGFLDLEWTVHWQVRRRYKSSLKSENWCGHFVIKRFKCVLIKHTLAFSAALPRWFVRVGAVRVAAQSTADDVSSIAVTHTTGVIVIIELCAIEIFSALKSAAYKKTVRELTLWTLIFQTPNIFAFESLTLTGHAAFSLNGVLTVEGWTAFPLTLDRALPTNTQRTRVCEVLPRLPVCSLSPIMETACTRD